MLVSQYRIIETGAARISVTNGHGFFYSDAVTIGSVDPDELFRIGCLLQVLASDLQKAKDAAK